MVSYYDTGKSVFLKVEGSPQKDGVEISANRAPKDHRKYFLVTQAPMK